MCVSFLLVVCFEFQVHNLFNIYRLTAHKDRSPKVLPSRLLLATTTLTYSLFSIVLSDFCVDLRSVIMENHERAHFLFHSRQTVQYKNKIIRPKMKIEYSYHNDILFCTWFQKKMFQDLRLHQRKLIHVNHIIVDHL